MKNIKLSEEKIAIITDSISDINKEVVDKYNIRVIPLKIIYGDKEYLDGVTITPEEVYSRMPQEVPTTSLPSPDMVDNIFSELEKEGYTHVISICVSSCLSGTYNMIKMISKQHINLKSYVFDSKSISAGEGCIVKKCAELIKEGKSFDYIVNLLPEIRKKSHVFYVLDTLEYLKKGGRIGKVSGTLGELLKIKPIISVDDEGKYYTYAKIRSKRQAINKMIDIAHEILKRSKCEVYVLNGGAKEECEALTNKILNLPNIKEIFTGPISPSAGVHTGPGLLGVILLEE